MHMHKLCTRRNPSDKNNNNNVYLNLYNKRYADLDRCISIIQYIVIHWIISIVL